SAVRGQGRSYKCISLNTPERPFFPAAVIGEHDRLKRRRWRWYLLLARKPAMVSAFQLCEGSSIGCDGTTFAVMPPDTLPVATTTRRLAATMDATTAQQWNAWADCRIDGRLRTFGDEIATHIDELDQIAQSLAAWCETLADRITALETRLQIAESAV